MANQHIFNNTLIITGSVTASEGFYGDGSGLTGITAVSEWDGSRNGDAEITGSFIVSGSGANVDFTNAEGGVSGSFSGSFEGDGSGLTGLNLNGLQASGSNFTGSFSGSFTGDGSGLTNLSIFPYNGNATITGSLTISGSSVVVDFTNTTAISGSIFSGSFVGDGSGLTGVTSEWDGSRDGNAEITGSFIVSGSTPTIQLLGVTTIDKNIEISNKGQDVDLGLGYQALPASENSRSSLAIGYRSATNSLLGVNNISIGLNSLYSSVCIGNNIAIGNCALYYNTGDDIGTGTNVGENVALGVDASKNLTTGNKTVAVGYQALEGATTSTRSVTIGHRAGYTANGSDNTLVGKSAGRNLDYGTRNVFIGTYAGCCGVSSTSVAVGVNALCKINAGKDNVAIGQGAGKYNIQGVGNVYIGPNSGPNTDTAENSKLYIASKAGSTNALIYGDFLTKQVTINSQVSASIFSGSFYGDGSNLTGVSGTGFPYNGDAVISGSLLVSQSTAAGTAVTVENGHVILTQVSESLNFRGDTAAAAAGVPLGGLYRSGNVIMIRIT